MSRLSIFTALIMKLNVSSKKGVFMNKIDKAELNRLRKAIAEARPGSAEYRNLLESRKMMATAMRIEGGDPEKTLVPGIKNETLAVGIFGTAQVLLLAYLQDLKFMPKNLFSKIPTINIKL